MTELPASLIREPETEGDAEDWIREAVETLGPGFDPDISLDKRLDLDPFVERLAQLDAARLRAVTLLGSWVRDVTYRNAAASLEKIDLNWREWARPPTSPPARLWDVRYRQNLDYPVVLAFEDGDGLWWEYEAATRQFHAVSWLFMDYYYRSRIGDPSFTLVRTPAEVVAVVSAGAGVHQDESVSELRLRDLEALAMPDVTLAAGIRIDP